MRVQAGCHTGREQADLLATRHNTQQVVVGVKMCAGAAAPRQGGERGREGMGLGTDVCSVLALCRLWWASKCMLERLPLDRVRERGRVGMGQRTDVSSVFALCGSVGAGGPPCGR